MQLPEEYVIQKFYQHCNRVVYNKQNGTYAGGCAVCREGKSWHKKRRCTYTPEKNLIGCFNCGYVSQPLKWIQTVEPGLTYQDILDETLSFENLPIIINKDPKPLPKVETLPKDSINLCDPAQVAYYKDHKVVQDALDIIKQRRLDTAINKPDSLWLSLTDYYMKNRIIIPFYDDNRSIIFYQARSIYSKDEPRYLNKFQSARALYNINKIDSSFEYIFIFEGPIDASFIKNGTAVCGINEGSYFTQLQQEQMLCYPLHKKIWVLDNQWIDIEARKKSNQLLDENENVFIWPYALKNYKDINEYCIDKKLDQIDPQFINENTFTGLKGKLALSVIR